MSHRSGRRRSGGCHACRRMKVKCDETKPACTRCQRIGRACPGYREDDDLFRSMNETSEQRVRTAKARQSPDSESSNTPSSALPMRSRLPSVPKTMATDLDHQAICHFFTTFTFPKDSRVGTTGHYEFLPDLCLEHPEATYLSEAIKACSLSNMANRSSLGKLVQRARKYYGSSLLQLNAALADPKLAVSDEVLSTITLLALYEVRFAAPTLREL